MVDDDAFEKEEKSFAVSESRSNLQSTSEMTAGSGRQQRKSKKPIKALNIQLDSLASSKQKAGRSQLTDCISQQFNFNSPHSASSSPPNSPTGSPILFTNNSLNNLASLTNPVNSSPLNSTNRATNSDHLNPSQSILPIAFIQKNQVLQGSAGGFSARAIVSRVFRIPVHPFLIRFLSSFSILPTVAQSKSDQSGLEQAIQF